MNLAATRNQWENALLIINTFPALGAPRLRLSKSTTKIQQNDAISRAFAFGLRSSTWEHAVSLCLGVGSVCSISTAQPLTELALLKMMNGGNNELLSRSLALLEKHGMQWTECVVRIALRVSLAKGDIKRCVELVSYGHKRFGACFSRHLLNKTFRLISQSETTMELIVFRRAISSVFPDGDDLLRAVCSTLADREFLSPAMPSQSETSRPNYVHENIKCLIRSGQWRNALAIAKAFGTTLPSLH
jgi:hypothetical protein